MSGSNVGTVYVLAKSPRTCQLLAFFPKWAETTYRNHTRQSTVFARTVSDMSFASESITDAKRRLTVPVALSWSNELDIVLEVIHNNG